MATITPAASDLPKTYTQLSSFAAEIYSNLLRKYRAGGNQFVDYRSEQTGLIYRCIGSVGMLLLINTFDNVGQDGEWSEIALAEFNETKRYIDENGFDSTPLGTASETKKYFSPKGNPERFHYLDSVSWVLAFALQMRLAQRQMRLKLDPNDGRVVREVIRQTVEILVQAVTPLGGWGFSNGCTKPDLYYSYCVSEALADFGDYIMGETEEVITADTEVIESLPKELIDSVAEVRRKTLDWLTKEYLQCLGEKEIEVYPETGSSSHMHLYGTFFVIDMLILNDVPLSGDSEKAQREQFSNRIQRAVEHAIYLSRIDFDRAYEDRAWWNSAVDSTLRLKWVNHPKISLSPPKLEEPGYVPLCLRCNALYSYYISLGRDEKLTSLFELVYLDRNIDTGLWDKEGDSLIITERSIEALVDYADFLRKFEKPEVSSSSMALPPPETSVSEIEQVIRKIVNDEVTVRLAASSSNASTEKATTAKVPDDAELLSALISVLEQTTLTLRGGKPIGKNVVTIEKKALKFGESLSDIFTALLSAKLRSHIEQVELHKSVSEEVLKSHNSDLMYSLAKWLQRPPDNKLGDLFEYLHRAQGKEEKTNLKPPASGGKR